MNFSKRPDQTGSIPTFYFHFQKKFSALESLKLSTCSFDLSKLSIGIESAISFGSSHRVQFQIGNY